MTNYEQLKQIDFTHLWHPFTQAKTWFADDPLIIERGEGVELIDLQGKRYLDGVSSLWCNVHGHNKEELITAIKEQADKICHSTLLGLSNQPIIELTEKLLSFTPKNLNRVFYADSGSTAVEAGLRMALEWWQKQDSPAARKKTRIASLLGAYHGDTLGAVNVGFLEIFHRHLEPVVTKALRVPPPHVFRMEHALSESAALERSVIELKKLFQEHGSELAAFIIEPLVQGAAGMWLHSVEFLREVKRQCEQYDVILIADEVATGFGKTGKMFAVELAGVNPDILIVAKGLSGGYLPISAAVTTERIFNGFVGDPEEYKTFFYGHTFSGNPLAAAVSLANLRLFSEPEIFSSLTTRIQHLTKEIQKNLSSLKHVYEVRQLGLMVGIELTTTPGKFAPYPVSELIPLKIVKAARKLGVIIRPLGNVMVLMPALAMDEEQLSRLVSVTAEAIQVTLDL